MKVGFWNVQIDIEKSFKERGYNMSPLDFHDSNWHEQFAKADCDVYVWYPHALHKQWYKLLDRALFVEKILGKKCYPSVKSSFLFQDKLHQKQVFDLHKIKTPKVDVLMTKTDIDNFLKINRYKLPLVAKDIWNYGGHGIKLIETKTELLKYIKNKKTPKDDWKVLPKHYIYLQEYIDMKTEYRVITVGNKIILSYQKKSEKFLKHVWRGSEVELGAEKDVLELVKGANKKLKLDWCGWDIARDKKGKLFLLEINPIFGTKVLEQNGINLADQLADYIGLK